LCSAPKVLAEKFSSGLGSGAKKFFEQRWAGGGGRGAEIIKYKFRFAPNLPSICINQEFQWEYGLLAHSLVI